MLDPGKLDERGQRAFDGALEGPVKTAVAKSKRQLRQTRSEHPDTDRSILMIVNNGNTALDQSDLLRIAARRASNDTTEIDGVIVAGSYQHGDGLDSVFLWPFEYVPIRADRSFRELEDLRKAFFAHAERTMTKALIEGQTATMTKGAVLDTGFDLDGRTFVRPAPPMGPDSEYYPGGRQRLNSTGLTHCPPVAIIFPEMARREWTQFRRLLPNEAELGETYEEWLNWQQPAFEADTPLKPAIPIAVTAEAWLAAIGRRVPSDAMKSIRHHANAVFQSRITAIIRHARDADKATVLPPRYVVALTELIGQDEALDVSHVALIEQRPAGPAAVTPLAKNLRIIHLHAMGLAAAYAVKLSASSVLWRKDLRYAWT